MYSFLTGRQFVRASARLSGVADADAAADRAIDMVQLRDAAKRAIGGYSKGMRQRVKVAAALVHDPPTLILDEPFNGMDPRQRLSMMDLLRAMAADGRTILFSSHILEEVERLSDRVLVVVAGRLAASGDFRRIRRLMIDRPHRFTLRSSDDRRLARELLALPEVEAVELRDGVLSVRTQDYGALTRAVAPAAQRAGVVTPRAASGRRVARVGLQLSRAPMIATLASLTFRALLNRRRTLLLGLLGALIVVVALIFRLGEPRRRRVAHLHAAACSPTSALRRSSRW